MPDPLFMIDDLAAPGIGEDTRHTPIPGPLSARRTEGFVGDNNRYVVKGVELPGSWLITGALLAEDFPTLYGLISTYSAMRQDITPHKISVHGEDYEPVDLASFRLVGQPHAYQSEGMVSAGARVQFQMLWELLS